MKAIAKILGVNLKRKYVEGYQMRHHPAELKITGGLQYKVNTQNVKSHPRGDESLLQRRRIKKVISKQKKSFYS